MLLSGVLEKKLSEHIRLTYFNVIEYEDFAKRLDECLVSIWFGPKEQRSLEVTKRKVRNYYESKLGDRSLLCGPAQSSSFISTWGKLDIGRLVLRQTSKRDR